MITRKKNQTFKNKLKNGGYVKVIFLDAVVTCWMPPRDLWNVYVKTEVPKNHVVAQFAEDGPYRVMRRADKQKVNN